MGQRTLSQNHAEARLTHLRDGLLKLHKVLLESERDVYERDIQRLKSRGELFALVLHDPWFAWLRDLSGLVVKIDERLAADEPATRSEAEHFIGEARTLLSPAEEGSGFEKRYFEALQRDPAVILAHAEMMKVLQSMG